MQCMRYLGRIWGSREIGIAGVIELTYGLFQPWLAMLGLLLVPFVLIAVALVATQDPAGLHHLMAHGGWILLGVYVLLGVGPFVVWGTVYRARCAQDRNFVVGIGWGLAYLVYVYTSYVTSWRAAFRLVFRRSSWAKTRRNAEVMAAEPVEVAQLRAVIASYQGGLAETFDAGQGASGLQIDWTQNSRSGV